jgi:hypothetical protein
MWTSPRVARWSRVLMGCIVFSALVGATAANSLVRADHMAGATYAGTHAGGGTVSFRVSRSGDAVLDFTVTNFVAGPCSFAQRQNSLPMGISRNHSFARSTTAIGTGYLLPSGSFLSGGRARGQFEYRAGSGDNLACSTSAPVTWTATAAGQTPTPTPPTALAGQMSLALATMTTLPTLTATPMPVGTVVPAPPPAMDVLPRAPSAAYRILGVLMIDGEPATTGLTIHARVGDRQCGRSTIGDQGTYELAVASADQVGGCGVEGAGVQLEVESDIGSRWPIARRFAFESGGATTADLFVALSALPPDPGNVPLTGWYWRDPTTLLISADRFPERVSDRARAAIRRAIQMWVDAAENQGLLTRLTQAIDACKDEEPNIVFIEADLPQQTSDLAIAQAFNRDRAECVRSTICEVFTGSIVVNRAKMDTQSDEELARAIARAIGRVLGLGSAMRCTGGTIMHDDPRCIFPARAIGVDDIAALNRRVQGYRP